jgi:hypothetical protein
MGSGEVIPASTQRYLFQLSALSELLQGPECLVPTLKIRGTGRAYLVYHLSDITSIPGALIALSNLAQLLCLAPILVEDP